MYFSHQNVLRTVVRFKKKIVIWIILFHFLIENKRMHNIIFNVIWLIKMPVFMIK